jgi:hypothetical protein
MLFASHFGQAQTTVTFIPKWNGQSLKLNTSYFDSTITDSLSFTGLRFYVSNVQFYQNNRIVYTAPTLAYLIDLEGKTQMQFPSLTSTYNTLKFTIGIDSNTNFAGALGNDLDPSLGMYWAWQSGYINLKIEGWSNACETRNHVFQFHVGGYLPPYQTWQEVTLQNISSKSINIGFDLAPFMAKSGLAVAPEVMSPNAKAVYLAQLFKTIFTKLP